MNFQKKADLTEREKDVLAHAWAFMNVTTLDHDKLAEAMGYSNPRSLYPVLKSAKEKLKKAKAADAGSSEDGAADGPAPSEFKKVRMSSTPTPRKRKAAGPANGASAVSTPSKGVKRGKKASTGGSGQEPIVVYDNDALEDGEV